MLGHAAHTQKGGFWLFFLSALICRFPLRVLSLSLLATSWWNAHHTRKVIEFEHSTIYPLLPPFDALILLATCWDRAFTFPWVPNETVERVSPASTSSWSGLNTRGTGGEEVYMEMMNRLDVICRQDLQVIFLFILLAAWIFFNVFSLSTAVPFLTWEMRNSFSRSYMYTMYILATLFLRICFALKKRTIIHLSIGNVYPPP